MSLRKARQSVRLISLTVAALLLCLGFCLGATSATSDGELPTAAHASHASRASSGGDGQMLLGGHPVAFTEEAEDEDEQPVNAELLTTLLLPAIFLRTLFWLLGDGEIFQGGTPLLAGRSSFLLPSSPKHISPLLSVFRL